MIDDAIEIYLHVIISLRTAQILRQTRDVIQKRRYFPPDKVCVTLVKVLNILQYDPMHCGEKSPCFMYQVPKGTCFTFWVPVYFFRSLFSVFGVKRFLSFLCGLHICRD